MTTGATLRHSIGGDLQKSLLPYSDSLLSAITNAESIVELIADKQPMEVAKAYRIAEAYVRADEIWKNEEGSWSVRRYEFGWVVTFTPLDLSWPSISVYLSDDGRITGEYIG